MGNVLAILDSDKKYVRKLTLFFERNVELPFEIQGFDDPARLCSRFQNDKAAVLLIESRCFEESLREKADQIILFVDKHSEECLNTENITTGYPAVCKFQSGDAICKKLLGICAVLPSETLNLNIGRQRIGTGCEIIGIYSPVKRCLQTSFALIYSRMKANRKKTLYLNFEVFSGFTEWFRKEYQTDLMDLLYFLRDDPNRFILKLAGMTEEFGNVRYIPPACSYEDFMAVSAEQWIRLIKTIAEKSDYEALILDLGDQMQGLFEILSMCNKIYTITKPDGLAMAKIAAYEELLRNAGKNEVLQKTVKCRLPVFKDIPQEIHTLPYSQLADYLKNKMGEDPEDDKGL